MSPTPLPDGTVRPAAVVNAEIRGLWPEGATTPTDAVRYRELLVEWAAAVRAERMRSEVTEAA